MSVSNCPETGRIAGQKGVGKGKRVAFFPAEKSAEVANLETFRAFDKYAPIKNASVIIVQRIKEREREEGRRDKKRKIRANRSGSCNDKRARREREGESRRDCSKSRAEYISGRRLRFAVRR